MGLSLASVTLAEPRIQVTGGAPSFQDAALKFAPLQTSPVTIQSFTPSSTQITAAVGDTLRFGVTATPQQGATLTFRWRVGGAVDATATASQYTYRVGGAGTVTGSVSNGQSTAEQTWTVTIRSGSTVASDFDGDGDVDFDDFFAFAAAFGKRQGEAGFAAKYDLSKNGKVDFDDFFIFADAFGK